MRIRTGAKVAAVTGVLALAGATVGANAFASDQHGQARHAAHHHQSPRLDHIFVIMLENHSRSSVIDDANAPYLTALAHRHAMADHYYGVTHPSMPNYIASIGGDNFGIQDDNDQNVVHLDRRNLVDQLSEAKVSWGAYMEDLPADKQASYGPTVNGTVEHLYAKKHNPFVLFDSVKNDPKRMARVRDYTRLSHDLNRAHPPKFVWISPNQCNDMHGGVYDTVPGHPETPCPYGSTKDDANDAALKAKADAFVKHAVHTIRTSDAWTHHSAIFIVTDENDFTGKKKTGGWENAHGCCDSPYVPAGDPRVSTTWPGGTYGGGLIPAIIVTRHGRHGYVDHRNYNHYSMLTTIEQNWHLGYIGHAGDKAGDVRGMWRAILKR
ncbi:MAG: alkaline phosphatase family protein [Nocardioides sp.]